MFVCSTTWYGLTSSFRSLMKPHRNPHLLKNRRSEKNLKKRMIIMLWLKKTRHNTKRSPWTMNATASD